MIIADDTIGRMRAWRHTLHAMPELAYHETDTADFVTDKLMAMGLRVERGLATTGVVGVLEGRGTSDRAVGFRCELDALPIVEATGAGVSISSPRRDACLRA